MRPAILNTWYAADFETNVPTSDENTYVWAWGVMEVAPQSELTYGTGILTFLEFMVRNKPGIYWFHNEKFDGSFILNYCLSHGFSYYDISSEQDQPDYSIGAIIGGQGQYYLISIKMNGRIYKIQDSLKKCPMPISKIAKSLKLERLKGEIDYKIHREEYADELAQDDLKYLENDVWILKEMLLRLFKNNKLNGITIGSDCMKEYKKLMIEEKNKILGTNIDPNSAKEQDKIFRSRFPELSDEVDSFIRKSYRGGYVFKKPGIKDVNELGFTIDYNSMYPSVMHSKLGYKYPIGNPIYFEGEPTNEKYELYVVHIKCILELLPNRWPTVQLKGNMLYKQTEYISTTDGQEEELYLTNVDLQWLLKNYNLEWTDITFIDGYYFNSSLGLFDSYINKWYEVKEQATKDKDPVLRYLSKLFLNNLYGKFGTNPYSTTKIPYIEEGILKFETREEKRDSVYIPVASFCTAYARNELWSALDILGYNYFCYCDTDSLHGIGKIPSVNLHDSNLGAWKHESSWTQAKFLRAKTYAELIDNNWDIKCAGMSDSIKESITIDQFDFGYKYVGQSYVDRYNELKNKSNLSIKERMELKLFEQDDWSKVIIVDKPKLQPKQIVGGVVLTDTVFKIKGED